MGNQKIKKELERIIDKIMDVDRRIADILRKWKREGPKITIPQYWVST